MSKKGQHSSPNPGTRRAQALEELRRTEERARRRSRVLLAAGIVGAVGLIATALIVVGLNRDPSQSRATSTAAKGVIKDVTGIPGSTYDEVGAGTATNHPTRITAPPLTRDNKPYVLYVGAEYCPFCAAQRWAEVAALSRFGTFKDLAQTASASEDVHPDTATLSFHGSSYTSEYLSFTGVETSSNKRQGNGYAPLDELTPEDTKLMETYNAPPYVDEQSRGSVPFTLMGGAFVSSGASFDPQLLEGRTHAQIAAVLADPDNDIAKAVVGTANVYTAALCELTENQPGDVCESDGVRAAASALGER